MNEKSATSYCPECGMRVGVNANFCPNCGFKLPKTRDSDTLKILEVRGDLGVVEVSDIRVMEGGKSITFAICLLQAPIEDCNVELYKILPEPIERKLLKGIITLRKEREFLGGTDMYDASEPEALKPLKRYKVCLYTKEENSKKACEEDVVHIASTFTGKVLERGFKYAITISGTMILGEVRGGHPMNVRAKVERDFSVEYIVEY
jgi:DNA-directed RNA polymerase subunit RPC12/RpoP